MTAQEKAFYDLQKYFLSLQHKLETYKIAGINPPDYLQKKIQQTKRRLHIFSKARKKTDS
jgi:hypothetical protein